MFHDYPITDCIDDVYGFKIKYLKSRSEGYTLNRGDDTDYSAGQYSRKGERSAHEPLLNLFDPNPQALSGSEGRPTPLEVRLLRFLLHHSY